MKLKLQPENGTGVQTEQDLREIADLIRGRNIAVLSDEPYCHMVWKGSIIRCWLSPA